MDTVDEIISDVTQALVADVAAAVKADQRYAPLVASLTEKALAGLAELAAA